jgi:hypothetical protein
MSVPEHFEKYLGPMEGGWSFSVGPKDVSVVSFPEQPYSGITTLATLGLSHHVLHQTEGSVRQELLLGFHNSHPTMELAKFLHYTSEQILHAHHAPLRGEILPLGGPILKGSAACNLYATVPAPYPDGLAGCFETTPPTVVVWLLPIMSTEAQWIQEKGWHSFEDLLEQKEPDFFDLKRKSIC